MRNHARSLLILTAILAGVAFGLVSCGAPATEQAPQQTSGPRRYTLKGRVVSIEKDQNRVTVDGAEIPGFMSAMTMAYPVKNPQLLDSIKPEDHITADVVLDENDFWLENIVVAGSKPPAPNGSQAASPGTNKQ